ncbi:hypothetical protein A6R68_11109, partial [Neotoma lepida]
MLKVSALIYPDTLTDSRQTNLSYFCCVLSKIRTCEDGHKERNPPGTEKPCFHPKKDENTTRKIFTKYSPLFPLEAQCGPRPSLQSPMSAHYELPMQKQRFAKKLAVSCSNTHIHQLLLFYCVGSVEIITILIVLVSYSFILFVILKMRSAEGRRKIFSTCESHLTGVSMYHGTILFMYVRLSSNYALEHDMIVSTFYTIVIPMLTPIIYSLRNKDVKEAMKKIFERNSFINTEPVLANRRVSYKTQVDTTNARTRDDHAETGTLRPKERAPFAVTLLLLLPLPPPLLPLPPPPPPPPPPPLVTDKVGQDGYSQCHHSPQSKGPKKRIKLWTSEFAPQG